MKQNIRFSSAVLSIASVAAFLTTGCVSKPYTQVQLGYANTRHEKDLGGHVDLLCMRARGGAKVGAQSQSEQNSAGRSEFRLGTDICYGKLPPSTSQRKYSVDVPVVGVTEADIQGATSSRLLKIAVPFLEYKYWGLEANFPWQGVQSSGLRSPYAKDLSVGSWISGGYVLDFTFSETDYSTYGGSIDNIPSMNIDGKFYGELTNEITLFGKFPLSLSFRIDEDKQISSSFLGGYKIQW